VRWSDWSGAIGYSAFRILAESGPMLRTAKTSPLHSGNFSISGLSIREFILDNDISRIGSRISSIYMLHTDLDKM
jgi:hypothetical protein